MLLDYKRILEKVYDPAAYAGRLERLSNLLDNSNRKRRTRAGNYRHGFNGSDMLHRIVHNLPEPREIFRPVFSRCVSSNPQSARWIVALTALYLHLGPFSRYVVGRSSKRSTIFRWATLMRTKRTVPAWPKRQILKSPRN